MPNPLMHCVPRENMPAHLQAIWDMGKERTGETALIEVMANAPDVLDWYFNSFYAGIFFKGRVDVRTKELLRMKLSKHHGCFFCNRNNTVDALNAGVTQEQIDNIFEIDSPCFDDRDRAILSFAEQMMLQNMNGHMDKALYDRLRAYYSDADLVEIGVVAAVLTGMAKWLFVTDLVTKEENCPIVPREAAE